MHEKSSVMGFLGETLFALIVGWFAGAVGTVLLSVLLGVVFLVALLLVMVAYAIVSSGHYPTEFLVATVVPIFSIGEDQILMLSTLVGVVVAIGSAIFIGGNYIIRGPSGNDEPTEEISEIVETPSA